MHFKHRIPEENVITDKSPIAISTDGYIRITFEELRDILLGHLISGLDDDKPILLQEGAILTEISGYTEWVSNTFPAISIGWDWIIKPLEVNGDYYKRSSEPRSNLMLIDAQQRDLGFAKTAALIEIVVDEMAWQGVIKDYINARYRT